MSMMLCANCASIDLSKALGPDPDDPVDPALHRWETIPKVCHYESYAGIIDAAGSCQLCAILVEAFKAPASICPSLDQSMYRYVTRVRKSLPDQARPLSTIIFGPENRSILHDSKRLDYCVVELYVDPGTKLANIDAILGRRVRAADDPTLLLEWLLQCDKSHLFCQQGKLQTFKPTRLIDVGTKESPRLRLRNGDQCLGSYATLSYCWGKTHHNLTTKSNIQAHQVGLDFSTLCKTMQDAITVTRNLKLKYLWIDALCIIQGDTEDWEREALSMSEVYAQSYITLAATSSPGSDGGLFFTRPTDPTAQLLWTFSDGSPPERVNFRIGNPKRYTSLVENGPLNKRSWALQERYLSSRVVHFTADRLYWECDKTTLEEGLNAPVTSYHSTMSSVRSAILHNVEVSHFDTSWREIVQIYTTTHLKYKTDRLPALAGLAKMWAKTSVDRYVAGCWQKHLLFHLLWNPQVHCEPTTMLQAPSWSWISFDGAVRFQGLMEPGSVVPLVSELVVTINGSSSATLYVGVHEGVLELTGRVKPTIFSDECRTDANAIMPWEVALNETGFEHLSASFDRRPKIGEGVTMLRLCGYEHRYIGWIEYVMLLDKVEGGESYERLGLGQITWTKSQGGVKGAASMNTMRKSWFDDVPDVRVRIY